MLLVVVDGDGVECTLVEGGVVNGDKAEAWCVVEKAVVLDATVEVGEDEVVLEFVVKVGAVDGGVEAAEGSDVVAEGEGAVVLGFGTVLREKEREKKRSHGALTFSKHFCVCSETIFAHTTLHHISYNNATHGGVLLMFQSCSVAGFPAKVMTILLWKGGDGKF